MQVLVWPSDYGERDIRNQMFKLGFGTPTYGIKMGPAPRFCGHWIPGFDTRSPFTSTFVFSVPRDRAHPLDAARLLYESVSEYSWQHRVYDVKIWLISTEPSALADHLSFIFGTNCTWHTLLSYQTASELLGKKDRKQQYSQMLRFEFVMQEFVLGPQNLLPSEPPPLEDVRHLPFDGDEQDVVPERVFYPRELAVFPIREYPFRFQMAPQRPQTHIPSVHVIEPPSPPPSSPDWSNVLKPAQPSTPGRPECIVCMEFCATICLISCGHQSICDNCARRMFTDGGGRISCPECRIVSSTIIRPHVHYTK